MAKVRAAVDQARHAGLSVQAVALPPATAGCPWTVKVTASSRVSYVFARAIPGGPHEADIHATVGRRPGPSGQHVGLQRVDALRRSAVGPASRLARPCGLTQPSEDDGGRPACRLERGQGSILGPWRTRSSA